MTNRKSVLQLGLRTILIGIAGIAVACAIAISATSSWSDERRLKFLWLLGTAIAGTAITGAILIAARYRAERRSGACLAVLPYLGKWYTHSMTTGLLSFNVLFLIGVLFSGSWMFSNPMHASTNRLGNFSLYVMSFAIGTMIGMSGTNTWFGTMGAVELCKNGVIVNGIRYYPWPSLRPIQWAGEVGDLKLGTKWIDIAISVRPEDCETVDQILREVELSRLK